MKKIQIVFIVVAVFLLGYVVFISDRNSENIPLQPTQNVGEDINIIPVPVPGDEDNTPQPVPNPGGKYDAFANCITEKGVKFYGAFWCSHCKANKDMFGTSVNLIPYVECSSEDGQSQLQICKDQKITGYPTWRFADGTEHLGEITFEILAEKTGCALPQ
ncbi:MAG: hypothetical protein ABH951_02545 [Patescibacteria group bacterium]